MSPAPADLEEAPPESARLLLELRSISKHFGGVQAVGDASLSIAPAAVHGLVGENGAGKSTLGKIVAGALAPDAGEIVLEGEPVRFHSPREALAAGIALIAQEIALVPKATVEENVLLGIEPQSRGLLHPREQRRRFNELNSLPLKHRIHHVLRLLPGQFQQRSVSVLAPHWYERISWMPQFIASVGQR